MVKAYKSIAARAGAVMAIFGICHLLGGTVVALLKADAAGGYGALSADFRCFAETFILMFFIYAVPIFAAALLFRPFIGKLSAGVMLKKPANFEKLYWFLPAVYGVSFSVNIITVIGRYLFSKAATGEFKAESVFDGLNMDTPFTMAVLFAYTVLLGPLFEEILFRGLFMRAFFPFGRGFAIVLQAVLFGLAHGNFQQFFYAFAVGIMLGYIAVISDGIRVTYAIHATVNAISIIMMFIAKSAKLPLDGDVSGAVQITEVNRAAMSATVIYTLCMFVFAVCGVVSAVKRIRRARVTGLFPNIPPPQVPEGMSDEMNYVKKNRVKWLLTVPVAWLAAVLIIDSFGNNFILQMILKRF